MARRQEQEPARSEVAEVAPDVLRMELPIRLPGLGHVNMYALLDDEGAAVVDPGLPGPGTWRAIQDRLAQAGLAVRHVHTVVVTHSHPDHFGCAVRFQREAGSRVVAHARFSFGPLEARRAAAEPEASADDVAAHVEAEAEAAAERGPAPEAEAAAERGGGPAEAGARSGTRWSGRTPWGGEPPRPPLRRRVQWWAMRLLGRSWLPAITVPVEGGAVLRLARREMRVLHTPGHTGDHICLHDPATGTLLAGDHVLPSITPHISGTSATRDPLAAFFDSLDRVAAIGGVERVLPAHGHPFRDLPGRCAAIQRHHQERLTRLKGISRELGHPASTREFARRLFAERSWGGMAESETYAHLEHLRLLGEAERLLGPDGVPLYLLG
jgi:glyoxylase-like metal-dependent hydrolase (beta-lactamase superfamily II)